QRKIIAEHHHRASVHIRPPHHTVGGRQSAELPARAVLALAGDGADLVKGGRVDEPFDALAHREPARLVLAADFFRPAHAPRHALARPQLFQFPLPTHTCLPEIGPPLMALWQRIDEYRCVWPCAAKGLRKLAFSNAPG